ncbi:MAG: (R,R)-butanediol dehydrogenase / meso-butanediol dehydrogenase / diacetyl reductase [Halanaerobiales bacterium]|nr:(R,R)-butanediol dehydrogenase / meso-butanediol dehydrogenase / diacetyl reductase [Halanaerobiales bacterium]
MKAAVYKGPCEISFEELALPSLLDDEVLIKVAYAGICGTDLHIFSGNYRTIPPMVIGHELSGEIVDIKTKQNTKFKTGDRVVIRPTIYCNKCYACLRGYKHVCKDLTMTGIDYPGAFAEYLKVPLDMVYQIPDGVSLKEAALIEPLAVAVHSVFSSSLKIGDEVAILGAGPIGLLIGQVARLAGAAEVYICDINDFRVGKARELGLKAINNQEIDFIEYIKRNTGGRMADITFEAAGSKYTAEVITEITSIRGQMVIVSAFRKAPEFNLLSVTFREQTVIGTRVYSDEDYRKALVLLQQHPEITGVITHIYSLKDTGKAIEAIREGKDVLKVLIKCQE